MLQEIGFSWRTFVNPDAEWSAGHALIQKTFCGQDLHTTHLRDNSLLEILICRALLVKSVRMNRLLPWIAGRFPLRGIVLLIRHPCAVVASQMVHPGFERQFQVPEMDRRFVDEYLPHLTSFVASLKHEEEIRALTWSLDQYVPLKLSAPKKWIPLYYERVVTDGLQELERLYSALGLSLSYRVQDMLRVNSREAHTWSPDHTYASVDERLSGWQKRLNQDQIDRVLAVVERVGIRGYGEEVVPRLDAIEIERVDA